MERIDLLHALEVADGVIADFLAARNSWQPGLVDTLWEALEPLQKAIDLADRILPLALAEAETDDALAARLQFHRHLLERLREAFPKLQNSLESERTELLEACQRITCAAAWAHTSRSQGFSR